MKKKILAFFLATAMTATLFSGCSGPGGTSATSSPNDSQPYNLTMCYIGNEQPDMQKVQDKINELTKKELNINVNIRQLGFGDYQDKLKLMLSGGDALDVFPIYVQSAASYVANGQLVNLSDLLDKYGSGIVNAVGKDFVRVATIGDFLYGLPANKESTALEGPVMRKDLVEKYKIDVNTIKSLDDLTPVFKKIKAGEPNMYMITGNNIIDQIETTDSLRDYLGVLMDGGQSTNVVNWYASDEFAHKAKVVREWYQAGYVMPDAATTTESNENLMKAGKSFSFISPIGKPGFEQQEKNATGYEVVDVPVNKPILMSTGVELFTWGIAHNSKDPVQAMKFLNFLYTNADAMNLLNWGIEGNNYKFVDKSKDIITYPDGVDATNAKYNMGIGWELPNQYLTHVWQGNPTDIWEKTKAFNNEGVKSKAFGFNYDSSSLATELTALSNVTNQYVKGLNTGSVDPDTTLPKFLQAMKDAGIDKVIQTKQQQLDEFLAKKK